MNRTIAEVVVVGGGPAGLTAAIALAGAGIETAVVAMPAAAHDNRTTALLASTVTALDTLGVWGALCGPGGTAQAHAADRRYGAAVACAGGLLRCCRDRPACLCIQYREPAFACGAGKPRPRYSRPARDRCQGRAPGHRRFRCFGVAQRWRTGFGPAGDRRRRPPLAMPNRSAHRNRKPALSADRAHLQSRACAAAWRHLD